MPNIDPGQFLYIVMGSTGEWSDRTEWAVLAFIDEEKAQAHVELATARANEIHQAQSRARRTGVDDDSSAQNEYDPHMGMDYNGTRYYVLSVPLSLSANEAPQDVPADAPDFWTVVRDA